MDFERVLKSLLIGFRGDQIRYAAVGGFALGVLGVLRATMDLDFLVHRDDLEKIHARFSDLGYQRVFLTENVSQYRHSEDVWGSVDLIHAFRRYALAMLGRAKDYPVFGGSQQVKVAEPEDIIGLKVQGMVNDPDRRSQEQADIERLIAVHCERLDWERIREYYELFSLGNEADQLKKRFSHAQ